MTELNLNKSGNLAIILIILCLNTLFYNTSSAKKIYYAECGRVYLRSGDSIIADGDQRVRVPIKFKRLEIIDNAYTNSNYIKTRIEPEEVDSVVIWSASAPEHPHTFRFIKKIGWCFETERTPYISVYCYSPKGYFCTGNGGLWMRGKSKMLVIKDDKIYDFGQPHKRCDKKTIRRLETLVDDDPQYLAHLKKFYGRRDKMLRSLRMYRPR